MNENISMSSSSKNDSQRLYVSVISSGDLISDESLNIFIWICYVGLTQTIDVIGTVANIINIVCFIKQGFKDMVNISLLGLAISDLGCLVTLIWTNICFNPAFNQLQLPFEPVEFVYLTGGWPHVTCTRITSWITAFITMERCLCIAMPLKVKMIFTHKRVLFIIVFIFVFLLSNVIPLYYVNRMVWKYSARRNRTLIGLVFTAEREEVETVTFAINNVFLQFSSFLIVVICTITIVVKLRSKSQWRKMSTGQGQTETTSTRDQKVTKMVAAISIFFIACFVPLGLTSIGVILEPEVSIEGRYKNVFILLCGFAFFLESTNSSANILIYYHMSTKYRAAFRQLFKRQDK